MVGEPSSGPVMSESVRDADTAILTVQDVSKAFKTDGHHVQALSQINLQVAAGKVTGLIGPDAAGKTTLMRLIAGLLVPDTGQITVLGLDAARDSLAIQAAIGYMPQHFGLYEELSVQENLDLYADLQNLPHAARPSHYQELMQMTGLGPFTSRLAGRLSGGMKQKLGLACTLIRPPRLLLLDEPTVGVDPVSRRELWTIVYRLVQETGMAVLLSTAYLDEAERCDEVALLHDGEVLGSGPPQSFSQQLQGYTYHVSAPGMRPRRLQQKLANAPGVLDAVIQGEHVRLVMTTSTMPVLQTLLPAVPNASQAAVPPRFEDSFIVHLRHRRAAARPPLAVGSLVGEVHRVPQGAVIEVHDLERRFGDFYAVRHLTFAVRQGEIFGLLGANGAGKTTTFRMLCGLLPASGGRLRVAGVDLRYAAAKARAHIGYMSQKFSLYGYLSVRQNLRFFGSAYGLVGRRRLARLDWALEQFELQSVSDMESGLLPLGYKQRLALACALLHNPDILFLDEPTSGVDPLARREFWTRINALAERGVTVLVTTHFMEEAEYCDRLAIMVAGEVLALDTPTAIKAQCNTPAQPQPSMEDAFVRLITATPTPGNS